MDDRDRHYVPTNVTVMTVALLVLFRVMIGYQPHSGQDDWHGLHSAYGGDFEAQRHWMELTYHLPIKDWYLKTHIGKIPEQHCKLLVKGIL